MRKRCKKLNITKIQTDLLKDILNRKGQQWFISISNDNVTLGSSYQLWVINKEDFILDTTILIHNGVKVIAPKNLLGDFENAESLVKTDIKRIIDKYTCMELKLKDDHIYVNEKLLKYYDKDAEFKAVKVNSLVYVYEEDLLVGAVLPVKVV